MNGTVHAFQSLQSLQVPQPLQSLQPHRTARPERAEVEAAVRTIIRWAGDGPDPQGLSETPARVVRALEEFFAGYEEDPAAVSQKSFDEIYGYDEMVVLRDDRLRKPLRAPYGAVQVFARRLQIQEKLTAQIVNTIDAELKPHGVAVVIKAVHHCMITRGVHKQETSLVTSRMLGCFRDDAEIRQQFLSMIE